MYEIDLSGLALLMAFEGDITAVDTETALATYGVAGALGNTAIKATIRKIIVACATDGAATGESVIWVRIRGKGGTPYDFPIGGEGGGTLAQSAAHVGNFMCYKVEIPWNGEIRAFAEMAGADTGSVNVGVWLYGN